MDQHSHFKRWGAAYLLLALFVASWVGQLVFMLVEIGNEARQHGQAFTMNEFWPRFFSATFENWQSEWLQLVFQAILLLGAKHWIFQVDAEDMERMEKKVDAIAERLGMDPNEADEPQPEQRQRA